MIRPMVLDDVPRVAEIQIFAWRTADRDIFSDEYLFKNMTVAKRIEYFENMAKNNIDENYVFDDGIVKAFITISACKDEDMLDALQISSIYVDPFFQRNGIGVQLVEYCEKIAIQQDFTKVCLGVGTKP